MSVEDEIRCQSQIINWICNKLFFEEDNKVIDHDHITGKYRGSAHCSCNINLKLTKNVPVIWYNLRGYDGYLIMQEVHNFDVKVNVMPNALEKRMTFIINNLLVACNLWTLD